MRIGTVGELLEDFQCGCFFHAVSPGLCPLQATFRGLETIL